MGGPSRSDKKNQEDNTRILTPKKITDALEETIGRSGPTQQLRDAIERVLLHRFNQPVTTSAELSESLCEKVAKEIEARSVVAERRGQVAEILLRSDCKIVHGSLLVFPDDDQSTITTKTSRLQSKSLLSAIHSLKFDDFEAFCRAVLRELGCRSPEVTNRSGDQGIDFYGKISIGELLRASSDTKRLMHLANVVIVGQAKHHLAGKIGPGEVRELVGALSLARTSTYSKEGLDLLDDVELRPYTPALAMLFTTGEITSGARRLAKEAGLVLYSGDQLAVFLADCRVGMCGSGSASKFDETVFREWIKGGA